MSYDYRDETGKFVPKPVNDAALVKEETGKQLESRPNMMAVGMSMALFANGGDSQNPMGFPGYGDLYLGNPVTYRWMLQHPVLRLVRSIAVSPIASSQWEYAKANDTVPDAWRDTIRRNFDPIRLSLLTDFFSRGRDYGWAGGEPIWEVVRGETRLVRVKPLLQDSTEILQDLHGNVVGLRNNIRAPGDNNKPIDLPSPYKAWVFTYDGEGGYVYGRSWMENVRATAWRDWLDCLQQMQRLGNKITGTTTVITSPAGTFPTTTPGKTVSYQENAEAVIKALANGAAGVWFPSLALAPDSRGNIDAMKLLAEMANKSLVNIDVKDFGSNAPAIGGLLERMKHDEELMFAGGLRPSRTGLEAQHGAKADAATHTDTGMLNAQVEDAQFAGDVQPLIDAVLVLNFGEKARGSIRIQTPKLLADKASLLRAILLSVLNDPPTAHEFIASVDFRSFLDYLGLFPTKQLDVKNIREESKPPVTTNPTKPGTPEPQGGRPKENA